MWEQRPFLHELCLLKKFNYTKINKTDSKVIPDSWRVTKLANNFWSYEHLCFKCCYLRSSCSHCARDHRRSRGVRFNGSCSLDDFGSKKVVDSISIYHIFCNHGYWAEFMGRRFVPHNGLHDMVPIRKLALFPSSLPTPNGMWLIWVYHFFST